MKGFLDGIRILDLTHIGPGGAGTQLLGDFGAEVIKIEPPGGEIGRHNYDPISFHGDNAFHLAFNRNKKSVCLDLRTPLGRQAFHDLVKVSDALCDNLQPQVLKSLGADYETISQINPQIISVSSSAYSCATPLADLPAYDVNAQAEAGIALATGLADQDPLRCGADVVSMFAGMFMALSVTTALRGRARAGKGFRIEVPLFDVGICLMNYHLVYYFLSGELLPRLGNGHVATAPHGIYETKDGSYVTLGMCWPRIARAIGEEWMIDDPRYETVDDRCDRRDELDEWVSAGFLKMNVADWMDILKMEDVSHAPVNHVDVVGEHPQVLAQQLIVEMAHVLGGNLKLVNNPVRLSHGPEPVEYTPPPLVGQHTKDVLEKLLGYSREQLTELDRPS